MPALIEIQNHGAIRELRLARPPVNALDPALCLALRDAVHQAAADDVDGVVLAGGPSVFSGGLDVPHLLALDGSGALRAAWDAFFSAARALAEAPMPIAAALAGHAPAGGCVLALCCDYRVMAAGPFRIGLNETQVGLVAPDGIQRLLRRVVGPRQAERLLVGGVLVDSEEALRIGLVDELVGIDEVPLRARLWLETLQTLPRTPMRQTRAIARADLAAALHPDALDLDRLIEAWHAPDTQAGLRALAARLGR
ncbi:enoyl-CoA hydratase/isomerase family protein [Luteimonas sp BLCC-B24]|uniref:enoyl-CoA hydratase/isomerase family protein n=1 Tax=Luteimonas sp. BLCC-B24 TaxID=3025317 RepID=UPI00234D59FC|nr:enoyl-CoA hydratase/isomerase family protein [Luteimonas sp. BLCC-B24]MDC7805673.1 enoyl-CoA hydratase/isomerase family protein [Luteimonas sp. BLCC-B24]